MRKIVRFIIEDIANTDLVGFIAICLIFLSAAGIGLCGYWVGKSIDWTPYPNLNYTVGHILGVLIGGGALLLVGWALGKFSTSVVSDDEINRSEGFSKFWKTFVTGYAFLASMIFILGIILGLGYGVIYFIKWLFSK